jgi:hypothetical protein
VYKQNSLNIKSSTQSVNAMSTRKKNPSSTRAHAARGAAGVVGVCDRGHCVFKKPPGNLVLTHSHGGSPKRMRRLCTLAASVGSPSGTGIDVLVGVLGLTFPRETSEPCNWSFITASLPKRTGASKFPQRTGANATASIASIFICKRSSVDKNDNCGEIGVGFGEL